MTGLTIVRLDPMDVIFVRVGGDVDGPAAAFKALESRLPSLRGRRFYGTWLAGEYRASVARRDGDDPTAGHLDTATLPGGPYARRRLERGYDRIKPTFCEMAGTVVCDPTRPEIEFYRRADEVLLFLPVVM